MREPTPPPQAQPGPWQRLLRAGSGLGLRLGLVSTVAVSLVVGAGAAYTYSNEQERLIGSMHQAASTQGRLTMTGLKFAMLENNRALLREMIGQYAQSAEVERVFLTDSRGTITMTSVADWAETVPLPEGVCPTCALVPGEPQTRTRVIAEGGRSMVRSLTLVPNEPTCNRCHPSGQKVLGALGVDFSMAAVERTRNAMVTRTLLWGAAVALLVLLVEGVVVQLGALRRLRRLRDAARSLVPVQEGGGDGPGPRRDEIGELADNIRTVSTALKDTQAEVDGQRRFLVDLIDQVEDGVAVFDRSLTVISANRSYLQQVGARREAVGNAELCCAGSSTLCGQPTAPCDCATRLSFRNGKLEKRIQKHPGTERYFEVFASPILGPDGKVMQVVEVWRDVTERVSLQANMARSEQLAVVGTLASGFSHEISTPLGTVSNSIQGVLRVLKDREQLSGPELLALKARIEVASREVFRCRDITRSLLDLGRQKRTVRDEVQVDRLVKRMLEVVAPTAERQQVAIVSRPAPGLRPVRGHADQLEQVLLNLFVNAIEAMPRGGTLEVALRPGDAGVELTVADTGPGVAADARPHIFEPFFSKKSGGTGLGLYVSRQIVEAHGGRLDLDPETQGGAAFKIFLPAGPAT